MYQRFAVYCTKFGANLINTENFIPLLSFRNLLEIKWGNGMLSQRTLRKCLYLKNIMTIVLKSPYKIHSKWILTNSKKILAACSDRKNQSGKGETSRVYNILQFQKTGKLDNKKVSNGNKKPAVSENNMNVRSILKKWNTSKCLIICSECPKNCVMTQACQGINRVVSTFAAVDTFV